MTSSPRSLLILDLDETLLFSTEKPLKRPESFCVGPYYVYLRPHVSPFLELCQSAFDLAIWTASTADYADAMVSQLFPVPETLKFVWSRNKCGRRHDAEERDFYWIKDLKKVRRLGYPLERILVVDDTTRNYERSYGNLVRVRAYQGDLEDNELEMLGPYLQSLALVENVRKFDKRAWRSAH